MDLTLRNDVMTILTSDTQRVGKIQYFWCYLRAKCVFSSAYTMSCPPFISLKNIIRGCFGPNSMDTTLP